MTDHGIIREWIQRDYQSVNGISCPWDGSEAKALTKMLKANPAWTSDEWRILVLNHFESEKANGERPRVWLPHISRWALGPLDKFGNLWRDRPAHRQQASPAGPQHVYCIKCGADLGEVEADDPDAEYICLGCQKEAER